MVLGPDRGVGSLTGGAGTVGGAGAAGDVGQWCTRCVLVPGAGQTRAGGGIALGGCAGGVGLVACGGTVLGAGPGGTGSVAIGAVLDPLGTGRLPASPVLPPPGGVLLRASWFSGALIAAAPAVVLAGFSARVAVAPAVVLARFGLTARVTAAGAESRLASAVPAPNGAEQTANTTLRVATSGILTAHRRRPETFDCLPSEATTYCHPPGCLLLTPVLTLNRGESRY